MIILICCIDWNALTAVGTILLAIATFITIRQNSKQLSEIRNQREEDIRARIDCSIIEWHNCYFFKIQNIGRNLDDLSEKIIEYYQRYLKRKGL